jgi:pimeloyl-ACP methyl ester carboxylesterase
MKVYKNSKAEQNVMSSYDKLLKLWNIGLEERDLTTSYGMTHVILCGKEHLPPLVLFHGVGDNSALMWVYNAKALSEHFRVIAIDTIGGPGKSRPNKNYNATFDVVQWIDEILSLLSLQNVYLTGVSNGTYLAQKYAASRPNQVIKLVCMAGSPPIGNFGSMKVMMKVFLPEALFPTKNNTIRLLRKLMGANHHVFTEEPTLFEHYYYLLKGFNNMAMRYHKIVHFNEEQIKAIQNKTLYLVGEDDPFAQLGAKQALLQYKMNAQFFPQVGHGINHEIADKVNEIVIGYLLRENYSPCICSSASSQGTE